MAQPSKGDDSDGRTRNVDADNGRARRNLPCRICVKARGLEWFVYNRSSAYDFILKNMSNVEEEKVDAAMDAEEPKNGKSVSQEIFGIDETISAPAQQADKEGHSSFPPLSAQSSLHQDSEVMPALPSLLQILPVKIECSKGAIVMGNQNTRSILKAKFEIATGHLEARSSRSADKYKQCIDFDFVHPVIQLKANRDFKEVQLAEGVKHQAEDGQSTAPTAKHFVHFSSRFSERLLNASKYYRSIFPFFKSTRDSLVPDHRGSTTNHHHSGYDGVIPGQSRWLGLTRYLDDDDETVEQERWKAIEYAQSLTIVDSPKIAMSYYWDVPGLIPMSIYRMPQPFDYSLEDINGDISPEWGVHFRIFGGNIRYGPWADRQRTDLQALFFPGLHKDAIRAELLKPGDLRMSTIFKLVVEFEEQTTWGVPTREESKDGRWRGRETARSGTDSNQKVKKEQYKKKRKKGEDASISTPDVRPFGWLDVKIFADSSISFTMDLVAKSSGFNNRVDLDLRGPEISTSVNHGLLWRSKSQKISCDLSYPLKWNALHPWNIDIQSDGPELFLLRDHIFLLTDLISDWTSGPVGDFHTFVPYDYNIKLHFNNCKIYLNANDFNIINNPSDTNDNTFVVLTGKDLAAFIKIPLRNFRSARNQVTFVADVHDGGMELRMPLWNTFHTFLDNPDVAVLKALKLDGSYEYFASTLPGLTDTLVLNLHGEGLRLYLYGFLLRYLIKIKDNYFGEDLHFRTVEEYQDQIARQEQFGKEAIKFEQHLRPGNDLDVILGIAVGNPRLILPSYIYSATETVNMEMSSIGLDLRLTNYYMDLAIILSPINISRASSDTLPKITTGSDLLTEIFIDGIQVYGHRLFGLPPTEPTYLCNWDFDFGSITGECCVEFIQSLILASRCFAFVFEDAENALPGSHLQVIHDITFLRVRIQPVHIWLRLDQAAFLLSLHESKIRYDDFAGEIFSEKFQVDVPSLTLAMINLEGKSIAAGTQHSLVLSSAYLETAVDARMLKRGLHFYNDRQLQQNHIRQHDMRTHRIPWLIHELEQSALPEGLYHRLKINPPAMSFPLMPEPVLEVFGSIIDYSLNSSVSVQTSASKLTMGRRDSFLARSSFRNNRGDYRLSSKASLRSSRRTKTGQGNFRASNKSSSTSAGDRNPRVPYLPENLPSPDSCIQVHTAGKHLGRPDFVFSTPYKKPYFSLAGIQLDSSALPALPNKPPADATNDFLSVLENSEIQRLDQETEKTSVMLQLVHGVRAFCTPEAIFSVNGLLVKMQSHDPVTLLDKLQIETVTETPKLLEKNSDHRNIVEVRLSIPLLEASLSNTAHWSLSLGSRRHKYILSFKKLVGTVRSSQKLPNGEASHWSGRLSANELSFSASELQDTSHQQAAIQVTIYDPLFWMFKGSNQTANLQCKETGLFATSNGFDFLTSLSRNTLIIYNKISQALSTREDEETPRLRLLVLALSANSDDIPDPPFLTKASYVLRSATNHPRTVDTWKLISRLRYVQKSLPGLEEQINTQNARIDLLYPDDFGKHVLESFNHWRGWDVAHIRKSHLMQRVYGPLINASSDHINQTIPFKISMKVENISILLELGPNQSSFLFERLVIGASMNQPCLATSKPLTSIHSEVKSLVAQVQCVKSTIDIDWDLYLYFEEVLKMFRGQNTTSSIAQQNLASTRISTENYRLHLIISLETSILNFHGLSLGISSACQGFQTSVVLEPTLASQTALMNALFKVNTMTSKVQSHSKVIVLSELDKPSISWSASGYGPNIEHRRAQTLLCSCHELLLEIFEDPLELLETVERMLRGEVAHFHALVRHLHPKVYPNPSSIESSYDMNEWNTFLSFFLNSFVISFTILPSLKYSLAGKSAQGSMQPGKHHRSQLAVDFELKGHSHVFTMQNRDYFDEISSLNIPPISGSTSMDLGSKPNVFVLHVMIHYVLLDASAVHSLLDTISQPEIASLTGRVSHEFSLLQKIWQKEFSLEDTASGRKPAVQDLILYNVHICLTGFAIVANVPEYDSTPPARLQFQSGCILLKASNVGTANQGQSMLPKLELKLKDLKIELSRIAISEFQSCGYVSLNVVLNLTSKISDDENLVPLYMVQINTPTVRLYAQTASMMVEFLGYFQNTLKKIDLSKEVKGFQRLTRVGLQRDSIIFNPFPDDHAQVNVISPAVFNAMYSLKIENGFIHWKVELVVPLPSSREAEDLTVSFTKIELSTRRDNAARLFIENLQLQMVPISKIAAGRSLNSALLPEVVFNVAYLSTQNDRRLAFQAAGKSLDLRLTSHFILPASDLSRSFASALKEVRRSTASWNVAKKQVNGRGRKLLGEKRLASLLIDADFAGAVVRIQGRSGSNLQKATFEVPSGKSAPQHGRNGQFSPQNASNSTTLRAPGVAVKVEFKDLGNNEPSLNAETKVDASSNTLYPTIVPLIMEISSSIKEVVGESDTSEHPPLEPKPAPSNTFEDEGVRIAAPNTILRHCKLNLGLRVCKQEFSLSCQPIARVAATARFEGIYITLNTVDSIDNEHFFTLSASFHHLQASVQHVYSRESTASFVVNSIVLSTMNSKHISPVNEIWAILKISPIKAQINVKQLHDFLLFREIWVPPDPQNSSLRPESKTQSESQAFIVQRYQQVAAAGAFPWNAIVSAAELDIQLDLGQSLGKSAIVVSNFWISSKKSSNWEQNLCLGFDKGGINNTGRMSGYIELQNFKVRTSIRWLAMEQILNQAPLVQASLGFDHLQAKIAFEFQVFLVTDITEFEFLMYNVRDSLQAHSDRLVGFMIAEKVQLFSTTNSASQGLALYQTIERLIQEKRAAYENSLREVEKFLRRKSSVIPLATNTAETQLKVAEKTAKTPLQLQTNVVVSLKAVNIGAFPSTFFDNQVFKLEAFETSARFAAKLDNGKIYSTLSMTMGQLRVALSSVTRGNTPKTLQEVQVDEVVACATGSRGGTILKVPRVVASMQTWQIPESSQIDYIFRSSFQGKVDVGWNYSRISFLRSMWTAHTRALAQRLGKPLSPSALQFTGGLPPEGDDGVDKFSEVRQKTITAVVNVPQSSFQYTALQPPVIETPQLRDMGEATPPLEWIGLHRERLPNLTHQIVIVSLLEVAKEVEDAYHKILGTS